MDAITFLLSLWFAGPLAKLESRSFHEREAATAELKAAGRLAWPAVWHAYRTNANPEAQWRLEKIVPEIDREMAFVACLRFGDVKKLASWLAARPGELSAGLAWIDTRGLSPYSMGSYGSERWARQLPYASGSFEGDVLKVLTSAREVLNRPPPKVMTGYSWGGQP